MSQLAAVVRVGPGLYRRVAGLTLLERVVISLQKAGISSVALLTPPAQREALEARLSRGRLAGLALVRLEAAEEREAEAVQTWRGSRALLRLDRPVAVDPRLLEALQGAFDEAPDQAATLGEFGRLIPAEAGFDAEPQRSLSPDDLPGTAVVVESSADGRRARRALLAQSIKPLDIDGVICWLLIRRISVRISAVLLSLPVSPNLVTLWSILLGLGAAVAVAVGDWPWPVIGGSLLMLSLIFDNCDGELARVKHQGSTFGAWLDIYGDFVVNAAFMSGMAVGAYRTFGAPVYLWAGAFAVFAFTVYNGTVFRYIHRLGIPDEFLFKWWFDQEAEAAEARARAAGQPVAPDDPEGPSALGRFLSGLKYMGRRDFFIFAYLVTAALGILHWAFWATVVGAALNFLMICYQLFFWKGVQHGDA